MAAQIVYDVTSYSRFVLESISNIRFDLPTPTTGRPYVQLLAITADRW